MKRDNVVYPITNRYTFASVFSKPENVRPLLEEAMRIPIGEIRIVDAEHVLESSLRGHGVRMDVFADDDTGTVYDVEMQNINRGDLAKRSRYLLSSFDRDRIRRGEPYYKLGKTVVIFVCGFDPFGSGDRRYEVSPMIVGRNIEFDDGTLRVFLNASGAASDERLVEKAGSDRLAAFLSYVDGGDTIGDEWVERLDSEVHALNNDEGWRDAVYGYDFDYVYDVEHAREEGERKGREEGREEGERRAAARLAALAEALMRAGRQDELARATLDPALMGRLLAEFGIESR